MIKDVYGYEGLYQVDSNGNVFSLDRVSKSTGRFIKGRKLKPHGRRIPSGTYQFVKLYDNNGNGKTIGVHRVVLLSFEGINKDKPYVNHIDNNPSNNELSNLEWCTQQENVDHMVRQGRNVSNADIMREHFVRIKESERTDKCIKFFGGNFLYTYREGKRSIVKFNCSECENESQIRLDDIERYNSTMCSKCKREPTKVTSIEQYDKDWNFIQSYSSIINAERATGVKSSSIFQMLSGKSKTAGGFKWKRKD